MKKNEINATQAVVAGASPVSLFENPEFGSVRIIVKENGEPLFCLKDVATCLGYANPTDAVSQRCDPSCICVLQTQHESGTKHTKFGPESEVYRLIFGSKLDSAKKFQDWVFKEVLPSIRKTETSEITSCISKDSVTEITVVNFLGRDIHVLGTPEDPLFIAKDVAEWIGLSNVSVMCRVLETSDIRKVYISSESSNGTVQNREVLAITEQGLYKILWRSNKPEAQKFASKCADIIKEIRLKGSYSVQKTPQTYIEALEETLRLAKENERLALENKKQATKIEEDAPKVECWNKFVSESNELISITDFAKVLHNKWSDITPHRLFAILREAKILQDGYFNKNIPYQHYIKEGYFKVKEKPSVNKVGLNFISRQTLVTPKGQKYLIGKFLSARASDEENDIDMFE